jgi:hypothetical protein
VFLYSQISSLFHEPRYMNFPVVVTFFVDVSWCNIIWEVIFLVFVILSYKDWDYVLNYSHGCFIIIFDQVELCHYIYFKQFNCSVQLLNRSKWYCTLQVELFNNASLTWHVTKLNVKVSSICFLLLCFWCLQTCGPTYAHVYFSTVQLLFRYCHFYVECEVLVF